MLTPTRSHLTGVLTVYQNNGLFDYHRLAQFTAKRAGELWNLPHACMPTHSVEGFERTFPGEGSQKHPFLNSHQIDAMERTPFEVTIFMDADFVPVTNWLATMARQVGPSNPLLFLGRRNVLRENLVDELYNPKVNPFDLWSTLLIYYMDNDPSSLTQKFIHYVKNVRENWPFYAKQLNMPESVYRNDFAFAIAAYRLRVPMQSVLMNMEYRCVFSFDTPCECLTRDSVSINGTRMPYDLHCMNKRSLLNAIQGAQDNG